MQDALGVLGATCPTTRSSAATCSWWARASSSRVLSSSRSRSSSLRSRCSSMSVRWSSCSSRWRSRRSRPDSSPRLARASSSASRWRRSFSSFASRISSFWRARASASMRRASAVAAFIVCEAQRLRTSTPSTAPPTAATRATARTTGVSICVPPIRPIGSVGGRVCRFGRSRSRGWGDRVARMRPVIPSDGPRSSPGWVAAPLGGAVDVCCVAYGPRRPRVNRTGNRAATPGRPRDAAYSETATRGARWRERCRVGRNRRHRRRPGRSDRQLAPPARPVASTSSSSDARRSAAAGRIAGTRSAW